MIVLIMIHGKGQFHAKSLEKRLYREGMMRNKV